MGYFQINQCLRWPFTCGFCLLFVCIVCFYGLFLKYFHVRLFVDTRWGGLVSRLSICVKSVDLYEAGPDLLFPASLS